MIPNNSERTGRGVASDAEIESDVAELRQLLSGVSGPREPHPAYWQNFVVHVQNRIDIEGARKRKMPWISTAWASVGAAAVVAIIAVSGLLTPGVDPPRVLGSGSSGTVVTPPVPSSRGLQTAYSDAGSRSLVLSEHDVKMVNAIESNNDDAIFEALVAPEEL